MITVIIPTYKPQEYIEQCLRSLELQTLDKNLFEVFVILNGEKIPYYSYIQRLISSYTFRSRLFYTDIAGVSNARNIGIDNAAGDYICFIDDDDYISSDYLKDLYSCISDHNTIVASNVKTFTTDSEILGDDYISIAFDKFTKHPTNSIFKKRKFLSSSCCKLIAKSVIGFYRFDTNYKLGEDSLFMFSISKNIKHIVLSSNSAIYHRRIRPGSASRQKQTCLSRIRIMMGLVRAYVRIYVTNIRKYSLLLFLSRIAAVIKTY